MGVITNLIRMGQEKKAKDQDNQLRAFELATKSNDPSLRAWGINNITELGVKHAPTPEAKKQIPILGKIAGLMGSMNPNPSAPKPAGGPAPAYSPERAQAEQQRQQAVELAKQEAVDKQSAKDAWTAKELAQENEIGSLDKALENKQITQEEHDDRIKELRLGKPGKGNWHNVEISFPGTNVPPVTAKQNQTDGSFQTLDGKTYTPPANASVKPVTAASGTPGPRARVTINEPGKDTPTVLFQDRSGKLFTVGGEEYKPPVGSSFAGAPAKQTDVDKVANHLLLSGKAKDKASADSMAAGMLADADKAKAKAAGAGGGGGAMSPAELQALARWQIATGQVPAFGLGANNPNRVAYQKQLAGLLGSSGDEGAALEQRAGFKGGQAALTKLMQAQGNVGAFERNARANIERAVKLSNQVGRTGAKLANEYLQWAQGNLEDYPLLANFRVAVDTAAKDYALVTTTATMGGVSTDSARAGAAALFNEHMAQGALEGAAESMYQDMDNRIKGLKDQIEQTRGGIRSTGRTGAGGTAAPAAAPAAGSPKAPSAATPPSSGKAYADRIKAAAGGGR